MGSGRSLTTASLTVRDARRRWWPRRRLPGVGPQGGRLGTTIGGEAAPLLDPKGTTATACSDIHFAATWLQRQ